MNPAKEIYLLVVIVLIALNLNAQDRVTQYPVRSTQPSNTQALENPAAVCSYNNTEVFIGNQRMVGSLSKISSYFAAGYFRINRTQNRNKPFSVLGISMYNDQEGKYINRSRFYAAYAWHGNIFDNTKISGGFKLGAINYAVKGTPLSGNGSDIKPDASVGVHIYNSKTFFGVSVNQLTKSELQPLQEVTQYNPFITFNVGGNYKVASDITIQPISSVFIPILHNGYSNKLLCSALIRANYRNIIDAGIGLHNSQRMVAEIGLPSLFDTSKTIELHISYTFLNLRSTSLNTPLIEIGLGYKVPSKY